MAETYNASQMAAVTAGLKGSQVVLIQGPPGKLSIPLSLSQRKANFVCFNAWFTLSLYLKQVGRPGFQLLGWDAHLFTYVDVCTFMCSGTGKTKTILGLLSIVMHSAPKGAFSTSAAPSAGAGGELSPKSAMKRRARGRDDLWLACSPWLAGKPDPRCMHGF